MPCPKFLGVLVLFPRLCTPPGCRHYTKQAEQNNRHGPQQGFSEPEQGTVVDLQEKISCTGEHTTAQIQCCSPLLSLRRKQMVTLAPCLFAASPDSQSSCMHPMSLAHSNLCCSSLPCPSNLLMLPPDPESPRNPRLPLPSHCLMRMAAGLHELGRHAAAPSDSHQQRMLHDRILIGCVHLHVLPCLAGPDSCPVMNPAEGSPVSRESADLKSTEAPWITWDSSDRSCHLPRPPWQRVQHCRPLQQSKEGCLRGCSCPVGPPSCPSAS